MKWQEYEANFDKEIKKLAVLVKEKMTSMLCMNNEQEWKDGKVWLLGYADLSTNQVIKGEGVLVWPVYDNEQEAFARFDGETIYLVEARQWTGEGPQIEDFFGFEIHDQNEYYVTEILEKDYKHVELEEILKEYQKPVVLEDKELGTLTYDRSSGSFEGNVLWKQKNIEVVMDVQAENKSSVTKAKNCLKQFVKAMDEWDFRMRNFAAMNLLREANEWSEKDDLSEQEIADKIEIMSVSMTASGSFAVIYNDADLFAGHNIWVSGSLKKGVSEATFQ